MTHHTRKFNNDDLIAILNLSKDATAIYSTEDLLIEMANDAMISFWGKDRSVVGQTFPEAVPELIGQPFFDLLKTFGGLESPMKQKIPPLNCWLRENCNGSIMILFTAL